MKRTNSFLLTAALVLGLSTFGIQADDKNKPADKKPTPEKQADDAAKKKAEADAAAKKKAEEEAKKKAAAAAAKKKAEEEAKKKAAAAAAAAKKKAEEEAKKKAAAAAAALKKAVDAEIAKRNEAAAKKAAMSIFKDKNLEKAVRRYVFEKRDSEEPIVAKDVENISTIKATGLGITDLSGLEHCRSLAALNIAGNRVSDLTPITG